MSRSDGKWQEDEGGLRWRIFYRKEKEYKEWTDGTKFWETSVEQTLVPRHLPKLQVSNESSQQRQLSRQRETSKQRDKSGQRDTSPAKRTRHERPERQYTTENDPRSAEATVANTRGRKLSNSTQGKKFGGAFALSSRPADPLGNEYPTASGVPASTTPAKPGFRTSLSKVSHGFTLVQKGDFTACREYVAKNPDVLKESENEILQEGINALKSGQVQYSESCVEKAVVIRECSELSPRGLREFFDDLGQNSRAQRDFEKTYIEAFQKVKRIAAVQSSRDDPVPSGTHTRHEAPVQTPQARLFPQTELPIRHAAQVQMPQARLSKDRDAYQTRSAILDATDNTSAAATLDPSILRATTHEFVPAPQYGATANRHGQGLFGAVSDSTPAGLSEPLHSFSLIQAGDFQSCKDYIKSNPKVLGENKNLLVLEAVQAQKNGKDLYVRACIQRAIIIQECKTYSLKDVREYLDNIINEEDDAVNDFYDSFDKAYKNIVERAGGRRRTTISQPEPPPTMAGQTLSSIPESKIEFKGTKGEEEKLDRRYKKRGDPEEFFAVGRVFALLWHENAGGSRTSKHGKPNFTSKSKYGENVFSHIRRMVVVRKRWGYCWCIAINSYGGRGVAKSGMSKQEVEAHTIIHMSTEPAVRSKDERGMTKDPIAVDMAQNQILDKWSRLNFAKPHTVEHSVKVLNVGTVCENDMPRLEGYWYNEMFGNHP